MNIAAWLSRTATRMPEAPALLQADRLLADYRGFAELASATAAWLRIRYGLQPGDRVALFMGNRAEYLVLLYAVWWAGGVAVPVNCKLHALEVAGILEDSGAAVLCTERSLTAPAGTPIVRVDDLRLFEAVPGVPIETPTGDAPLPRRDDDPAWLFYTSGTTGTPKGVMLSHGNLVAMSLAYLSDVDVVHADDGTLYAAPISHGAGLYNFVHVLRGARHVLPPSGGFDADEVLALGRRCGPLHLFAAPTMVRRLTDAARRDGEPGARPGEGLRTVVYGGGPMYVADIQDALAVFGPRFVQIYGQGESPMCITVLGRDEIADAGHARWVQRLAGVGRAQSSVEVRVVDGQGADVPANSVGEIIVRGPTVMAGYWRNEPATATALRDGWLWTGDMGTLDGEGYLTLKDRSKDLIISGGSNIYPREVEECLLRHATVAEVCVVGEADREWGENVVAFVVLKPGAAVDSSALDALCLQHMARFKRPKRYVFVEALPKNHNGKVLKGPLRAQLAQDAQANARELP